MRPASFWSSIVVADRAGRDPLGARDPGSAQPSHQPDLEQARAWIGCKLDDIGGATAGRVEVVLADSKRGEPTWLLIRAGRLGHRSAVPLGVVAGGVGYVWVPHPRDLIRSSPEVDPAAGIGPEQEAALCDHYGIPPAARRAGPEGRGVEALSSFPAPPG
jgi:hypothetical protein